MTVKFASLSDFDDSDSDMDRLCQPLSIDTSIAYDLDIAMFPGLDNVLELQEPSLLIWTPETHRQWLDAVQADEDVDSSFGDDFECSSIGEDDLYDLIESCPLDMLTWTCQSDAEVAGFQSSLDDIIDSTSSAEESTGGSFSDADSSQCDVDAAHAAVTPEVPSTTLTPPLTPRDDLEYVGAQTLKRNHEEETSGLTKRFKGEENVVVTWFLHELHDICYRNS